MKYIYSLGIWFYGLAILIAGLFNDKAKRWKEGRRNYFNVLRNALQNNQSPIAWFHCASLGEFEQGRPVMEAFRQKHPEYKVLLTFFSPSGYDAAKEYKGADYILYLPLDTYSNAKRFVSTVKPSVAVFVKYEFWFNYLQQLKNRNIPVYLVSAKFRADQHFFKWYGGWFRKWLKVYVKIFVQDADSEKLLAGIGVKNVEVSGDTRFDRVIAIAEQAKGNEMIEAFKGSSKLLICGSTWQEDEEAILSAFNNIRQSGKDLKLLLVPHEIGEKHVKQLVEQFRAVKYTSSSVDNVTKADVLVVDTMGMLSSLYRYGDIAYVGGGFGNDGVHNLPEAAVYGIPVVFGPVYHKYSEAIELLKLHGGFTISSEEELQKQLKRLLGDEQYCKWCGAAAKAYIYSGQGATARIIESLKL